MAQIALQVPVVGQPNSTEAPKIAGDFTTLQTAINGQLDATNLTAAVAASAGLNATAVVKGAVSNAGPGTRTNIGYGALNDAPDQVAGIVLPTNGLIAVWFQATWQESSPVAGRAAIFIGANQLKLAPENFASPIVQEASTSNANAGIATPLGTSASGLSGIGAGTTNYLGDVTTGQIVGGSMTSVAGSQGGGGPCWVFAAAGTYTVSVQYKASSGTVTVSNRKLWVQALSFS